MQRPYFHSHYTDPQIPHSDSLLTKLTFEYVLVRNAEIEKCSCILKKKVIQNRQYLTQQFRDKVIKTLISGSYVEVPSLE